MKKIVFKLLIVMFIFVILINIFFKRMEPFLVRYSQFEIRKILSDTISKAIKENLVVDELYKIKLNDEGKIILMDLNSNYINQVLSNITRKIQNDLQTIEINKNRFKGIILYVPISIFLGNNLLSNLGPKIPVKLQLVGDVSGNLKTKVSDYGINNILIEISFIISIKEQILVPFYNKTVDIEKEVPINTKIISGEVPNLYNKN